MFARLHGSSWEEYQRDAVCGVLADPGMSVWVAEAETCWPGSWRRR
jgi:hypothetical protein